MDDWREELLYTMNDTHGCYFEECVFQMTEKNDHEHCSICLSKIGNGAAFDEAHSYYCKETGDWICCRCFENFKGRFDWRLKKI